MAKNLIMQNGRQFPVVCSSPAVPTSGIPVRYGNMTGVALNDEGAGGVALATETVVDFGQAIWDIEVVDTGGGGIAAGDTLFFHDANPPTINSVSAAGYFFGFALEAVGAGATDTINVLHVPSPAAGALGAGTVGTVNLATDSVDNNILANIARGSVKVGGVANAPTDLDCKTAGQILVGDGTGVASVAVSVDASLSAAGVLRVLKMGVAANGTVVANNATGNIAAGDLDKIHTNTGAGGAIVLTLPAVAGNGGKFLKAQVTVAQTVTLTPQAGEAIFLGGSGVVSKYLLIAGVISNHVDVYCDGARWLVLNYAGVVTKEA